MIKVIYIIFVSIIPFTHIALALTFCPHHELSEFVIVRNAARMPSFVKHMHLTIDIISDIFIFSETGACLCHCAWVGVGGQQNGAVGRRDTEDIHAMRRAHPVVYDTLLSKL